MGIIAEFTTPASTFAIGRALDDEADQTVELERVVPTDEAMIPFFWVWGGDLGAYEQRLRREHDVEIDGPIAETNAGALYRLHWDNVMAATIRELFELDFTLLSGTATANGWRFEIRFPSGSVATDFKAYLTEQGVPHELTRVHELSDLGPRTATYLTEEQREALLVAHEGGFFEEPRGLTTRELAERLDIAPSSASGRLRRALDRVVERTLIAERALARSELR